MSFGRLALMARGSRSSPSLASHSKVTVGPHQSQRHEFAANWMPLSGCFWKGILAVADLWLCSDCCEWHPISVELCNHTECRCGVCYQPHQGHECPLDYEQDERDPFEPASLRAEGEGWYLERDWGLAFYYRGSRLGNRFCAPNADKLADELLDLARCANEAAAALGKSTTASSPSPRKRGRNV